MEKTFFKDYQNLIKSFDALKKSEENPFFKSKYVPLKVILPIVKENCIKNNFIFMQYPIMIDGVSCLGTTLKHESGEEIKGQVKLVHKPDDPQKMGASITYMRRYMLTCMLGLEEEDDDGNTASDKYKKEELVKVGFCNICGEQGIKSPKSGQYFCPNWKQHKADGEKWKLVQPDSRSEEEKKFAKELDEIPVIQIDN